MDEAEALEVLAQFPALGATRAAPVGDGWASDTFAVDDRWIFRFPRTDTVGTDLRKEMRLLPSLAEHVGFAVPRFEWLGEHRGRLFVGYERIAGNPVEPIDLDGDPDLAGQIGRALRELHDFPVDVARRLCEVTGTVDAWRDEYEELRRTTRARVAPLLEPETARALEQHFDDFLVRVDFAPVLVHRDLGVEHVLVATDGLAGIIDFEDATVGDPVIDLVGFAIELGRAWTDRIADAYGTPIDDAARDRMRFYIVMGAVHAVVYGLDIGDDALLAGAAANIGRRMALPR